MIKTKNSKYDNQINDAILKMQFFCLSPDLEVYQELKSNLKLKNNQAELFDIWNLAVIAKYGQYWSFEKELIQTSSKKFIYESGRLSSMLVNRPTAKLLDKVWYIFFATGELNALRAVFEVAGNLRASKELKETALKMFETFRDEYKQKIILIRDHLKQNKIKNEITKIQLENLSVFERFEALLQETTKEIENLENDPLSEDVNEIISKTDLILDKNAEQLDEEENKLDTKKSKERLELKAKMEEATALFDLISQDVMSRVQLKKK